MTKTGKIGNPNFKAKWNNLPTKLIRVPQKFSPSLIYIARLLDQGKLTIDQIEGIIKDDFIFDITDRTIIFVNGKAKDYQYAKTLFSDRLDIFINYPQSLNQWEKPDFKQLITQLNLIDNSNPIKFIFREIKDHFTELPIIEIQIWEEK
jgi:hypothetical protein